MTSIEQGNTIIDTRHIVYNSSSGASKGLMNIQRPLETRGILAISTLIRAEPIQEKAIIITRPAAEVEREARIANIDVTPIKEASDKNSDGSSETSYDANEEKISPKNQVIQIEEKPSKPVVAPTRVNKEAEPMGVVEIKGLGGRDHYLSEGYVIFRVLESKFRPIAKLDAKNKPYYKFRLGFNTKRTKSAAVEGKALKIEEEIKVKYSNQDQVIIKVKGKGRLVDNVIAKTKVSIVDVIMEGKQTVWAPLLKGDEVVGEIKLEMEFAPKK